MSRHEDVIPDCLRKHSEFNLGKDLDESLRKHELELQRMSEKNIQQSDNQLAENLQTEPSGFKIT